MITTVTSPANKEVKKDANRVLRKERQARAKRERLQQKKAQQAQAKLRQPKRTLARITLEKVLVINVFAIIATVTVSAPFQLIKQQFSEGGFITYFSAVQLCILSYLSYKVFQERARSRKYPLRYPLAVWIIISIGFAFLAFDEVLMFHEWIEATIHSIGQFPATAISTRIDDLIIGLYGPLAIGLLAYFHRELRKYRNVLPYVAAGMALMFLMVGVDTLTSGNGLLAHNLLASTFSDEMTTRIMSWALVLEEALKLFSEAFLIVAAYLCYHRAQQINPKKLNATEKA